MPAVDYRQGDYAVIAQRLLPAAEHLVQLAAPTSGQVVVDVAAGSGNVSRLCAARGARPVAVDRVREQLLLGGAQADIGWVQGDAHALPVADGAADAVLSTFGLIFANRPDVALADVARVLRNGGTVGVTAWPQGGWQAAQVALAADVSGETPSGYDHLAEWGLPEALQDKLSRFGDVEVEKGVLTARFDSVESWWTERAAASPRTVSARQELGEERFADFGRRMRELAREHMTQDGDGVVMNEEYLVAVARG